MAAMPVLIGLIAAGTAVTAIGAISSANAAASASKYNASVADQNAVAAQQQAEGAARIQQEQAQRTIGSAIANYGASGIVSGTGTPLDVLANSAANAERDRQNIYYKGALQAAGYSDESALDRASASNASSQGLMSATGILLGGGAKAVGMGMLASKPTPAYTGDGNGEW